jgi:hypothetical protein
MSVTRKYFAKGEKPVLTAEQLEELEALRYREINLSDAPEVTDWSGAVRGRFMQKRLPVSNEAYEWLQKGGQPAEVRLNELLQELMQKESESAVK